MFHNHIAQLAILLFYIFKTTFPQTHTNIEREREGERKRCTLVENMTKKQYKFLFKNNII